MSLQDVSNKLGGLSGTVGNLVGEAIGLRTGEKPDPVLSTGRVSEERLLDANITRQIGGFGELAGAVALAYYGFNHRGFGNPIQANTDNYGLTFFTRPRLNLSYDNIVRDRIFTVLANTQENSVPRAVRAWLDPVGSKQGGTPPTLKRRRPLDPNSGGHLNTPGGRGYHCPLVDDLNPFITILSNNLLNLSGWPDPYVETYTSTEGVYKEQWSMIDGPSKFHSTFSLSANFRNIVDDPITLLFNIWTQYASRVYDGTFMPWLDAIFDNYVDYQTRVYRLVLDHSRTYVQKIAATGAAFPTANNLGASFNYNSEKPYTDELDNISVSFQCMGAIYNDPILVDSFNKVSYIFNPALSQMKNITVKENGRDVMKRSNPFFKLLTANEKLAFNYLGYPQINPDTMELEWWVKNETYDEIINSMGSAGGDPISRAISALKSFGVETPAAVSNAVNLANRF